MKTGEDESLAVAMETKSDSLALSGGDMGDMDKQKIARPVKTIMFSNSGNAVGNYSENGRGISNSDDVQLDSENAVGNASGSAGNSNSNEVKSDSGYSLGNSFGPGIRNSNSQEVKAESDHSDNVENEDTIDPSSETAPARMQVGERVAGQKRKREDKADRDINEPKTKNPKVAR